MRSRGTSEANGEFLVQIGKSAFPKVVEGVRHTVVKLILIPKRIILVPSAIGLCWEGGRGAIPQFENDQYKIQSKGDFSCVNDAFLASFSPLFPPQLVKKRTFATFDRFCHYPPMASAKKIFWPIP